MRKTLLALREAADVPEVSKPGGPQKTKAKSKAKSKAKPKAKPKTKAKAVIERPSLPPGWLTTDDDELRVRRWRGETEIATINALETGEPVFGTFRVQSASGSSYDVEIRSLNDAINSCGCIDHRVNGLGTCKHIEGVIAALTPKPTKAGADAVRAGTGRIEVFLDLITEDSIEHNILHLLGRKQALADGVMDGIGDLSALKMPSGRAAFLERMQQMMEGREGRSRPVLSSEEVAAELVQRHGERAILIEARRDVSGAQRIVAVLDLDAPSITAERERLSPGLAIEIIDHTSWLAVQQLAAAGVLQFTHEARTLHGPASGAAG